ncbi:hypothetical protein BC829DRAFT_493558 [Chytridium lagenaria]|nr:hypothetical protein BC829DRAFT_493558 [Chytridium lagenaria]
MAKVPSFNITADLYLEDECYYSQIKDCEMVSGWRETATVLLWINWCTFFLGISTTLLSVYVRRKRAEVRNTSLPKYHQLSQFEVFLALMAVSSLLNATALSLSVYVSIRTLLLHSLSGLGAFILYVAALLFVNMVLKSNSLQNRTIRIIRTVFLPMLLLPITSVVALFIYQGYYSDYFQFEEHTKTVRSRFTLIVSACAGLWLIAFIALDIVLIVARNSFAVHLRSVLVLPIGRVSSSMQDSGIASRKGSPEHVSSSQQKSTTGATLALNQQAEVVLALKNAVATLGWLAVGTTTLIAYSLFYGVSIFMISNASFLYFSTLIVSYCTAFLLL